MQVSGFEHCLRTAENKIASKLVLIDWWYTRAVTLGKWIHASYCQQHFLHHCLTATAFNARSLAASWGKHATFAYEPRFVIVTGFIFESLPLKSNLHKFYRADLYSKSEKEMAKTTKTRPR